MAKWPLLYRPEPLFDAATPAGDRPIVSAEDSGCVVRLVRTDEESVIARETVAISEAGRK